MDIRASGESFSDHPRSGGTDYLFKILKSKGISVQWRHDLDRAVGHCGSGARVFADCGRPVTPVGHDVWLALLFFSTSDDFHHPPSVGFSRSPENWQMDISASHSDDNLD